MYLVYCTLPKCYSVPCALIILNLTANVLRWILYTCYSVLYRLVTLYLVYRTDFLSQCTWCILPTCQSVPGVPDRLLVTVYLVYLTDVSQCSWCTLPTCHSVPGVLYRLVTVYRVYWTDFAQCPWCTGPTCHSVPGVLDRLCQTLNYRICDLIYDNLFIF